MSEPHSPVDVPPAEPGPVPQDVEWRRLDPRMLLVHPVTELIRFLPVLIGIFVLGGGGGELWQIAGVAVPVALGLLRYVTTRFRITTSQVELQRGLLSRSVLTAKLDRVRAVELTSSLMHRLLGLAKVEIGTGSAAREGGESFALDSLRLSEARELRAALLHRADPQAETMGADESVAEDAEQRDDDEVLLRLDPRWARYAPLTSTGTIVAAAVLGFSAQFTNGIDIYIDEGTWLVRLVQDHPVPTVLVAVLVFLVLAAVFGVIGYLVVNGGFVLSRDRRGRSFNVRRGLLTSRETSLEVERVRGLEVAEPLGLRWAGAARLGAIVTGVSKKESGTTPLVPPAPRGIVDATGSTMLGQSEPLHLTLVQHGPRARVRRFTRALAPAALLPVVVVVLVLTTSAPGWLPLIALLALLPAALLAADRYRRLGHALTEGYLVVRAGSLWGRRDVLQRTGIIGWNVRQSWFQRRAGLATLVATTAAGRQAYAAIDVPVEQAVAVADEAVPGLLTPFLA